MRISEYLNQQRVSFDYLPHAPAFTATQLAKYLHIPGEQVAKCVLLRGPANYFVAILPATYSLIDRSAKWGIIKKNTAARYKSRTTKRIKALTAKAA